MSKQIPSPLSLLLASIPDESIRVELARWAAEHRVEPNDPLWAVLRLTVYSDGWTRRNLADLERAAIAVRGQIQAEAQRGISDVSRQAAIAAEEARLDLLDELTRMTTRATMDITESATTAIRRAELRGPWWWVTSMGGNTLTGIVVGMLVLAAPAIQDRVRGQTAEQRNACEVGADLTAKWDLLTMEDRKRITAAMNWTLLREEELGGQK